MKKLEKIPYVEIWRKLQNEEKDLGDLSSLSLMELKSLSSDFPHSESLNKELVNKLNSIKDVFILESICSNDYPFAEAYFVVEDLVKEMSIREQLYLLTREGFLTEEFRKIIDEKDSKNAWTLWNKKMYIHKSGGLHFENEFEDSPGMINAKSLIEPIVLVDSNRSTIETVDACNPESTSGELVLVTSPLGVCVLFVDKGAQVDIDGQNVLVDGRKVDTESYLKLNFYTKHHCGSYNFSRPYLSWRYLTLPSFKLEKIGEFNNLNKDERGSCASPDSYGQVHQETDSYYPNIGILSLFTLPGNKY
jgi:hypothetical protein